MRRLHPATIVVAFFPNLIEVLKTFGPVLLTSAISGKSDRADIYVALIGLLGGFGAVGTFLSTRFEIEADRVIWRSGLIWKRDRQIPLGMIQNVSLTQSLLERLFRVATVEVETAAGGGPELKLRVLGRMDATAFRDELLQASSLTRRGASVSEQGVHRISRRDLVYGALSENHLGYMVLTLVTTSLGGKVLISAQSGRFWTVAQTAPWLIILAGFTLVALLAVAGWVWGAATFVLKYGNFGVGQDHDTFRVSYGLLNRVQLNVRQSRIEIATVKATLIQRWLGRATVTVATAGTFGEAGAEAPLALMIPRSEAESLVQSLVGTSSLSELKWHPFPRVYFRASVFSALWSTLLLGGLGALLITLMPMQGKLIGAMPLIFLPFAYLHVIALFLSRRESGYAWNESVLVLRQGYVTQAVSIIPWDRVEYSSARQGPFWRSRRAWSLTVGGMARFLTIPGLNERDMEIIRLHLDERQKARQAPNRHVTEPG